MFFAGLDLSRKRLDVHVVDAGGATVARTAAPPDADGLCGLVERLDAFGPVCAAIESMNGARFVHDRLEQLGWDVEIADAQKVKGLAPLACKSDRIDAWVLAELGRRDLVPAIWLPDRPSGPSASGRAGDCTWCAIGCNSRTAFTRRCSRSARRARSATCSARAAAGCWIASASRIHGALIWWPPSR
jgi:hypothetical protein